MVTKAIRSVRTQASSFQLIVADDGSNEETRQAISLAFAGDPRCRVIYSDRPREGELADPAVRAVMCINDAIRLIDADLVHYLPDDDWYAPGRFPAFERFFEANPLCDVAYGRLKYIENDEPAGELYHGRVLTDPVCRVDHGQFCHRFSCFQQAPEWPATAGDYAFDAAYFRKLIAAGYSFYPIDTLVSYKRRHEKNLQNTGTSSIDERE
jgi:glycosyltransferase involved in cell wall biosynthesis